MTAADAIVKVKLVPADVALSVPSPKTSAPHVGAPGMPELSVVGVMMIVLPATGALVFIV